MYTRQQIIEDIQRFHYPIHEIEVNETWVDDAFLIGIRVISSKNYHYVFWESIGGSTYTKNGKQKKYIKDFTKLKPSVVTGNRSRQC